MAEITIPVKFSESQILESIKKVSENFPNLKVERIDNDWHKIRVEHIIWRGSLGELAKELIEFGLQLDAALIESREH